ncbi:MAG: hypothetical protein H7Z40_01205 [Phycisphaerae bacterium]|nr:hypothetical protein [Gemmatimonadaceae bacterium]
MNPFLVPITLFITIGAVVVLTPIARAFARRMDRASSQEIPQHVDARLERMEQAIEAMAEQVERVAEGQRFTTKLLSERTPAKPVELRGE